MPQTADPSDELAAAKRKLLGTAGAIDPLAAVRSKPYTLVLTAALVGAVLGSSRGTVGGSMKLASSAFGFLRPLLLSLSKIVMARMAANHHAAEAAHNASEAADHAAAAAHAADMQNPAA